MQNKKFEKIERDFDKHRKDDWHYLDVNNEYTKEIKQFFKKQFQNQCQEFMDIVESKINDRNVSSYYTCQKILKELNK